MHWDLFCRVIDNFGDIGVCWRLAADLGARGDSVRLRLDDASALAWMAPQGAPNVQVLPGMPASNPATWWSKPSAATRHRPSWHAWRSVIPPPLWINLEYLSAEAYVRRSHGLRSPQLAGPGCGLDKWFFYPASKPAPADCCAKAG